MTSSLPLRQAVSRLILTVSLLALPLASGEAKPAAEFDPSVVIAGERIPLRGTGRLTWGIFFTVYDGALYLPQEVAADQVLELVPKRLEIHYFTRIKARQFAAVAAPVLQRNLPVELLAEIRPGIEQINRLYRDVESGDRYALTCIPDVGTELALNGEVLGVIPGDAFAWAYFAIWLGEEPLDEGFREGLLGG